MRTEIEGTVGDKRVDGWVHWTTCDHGMSYNPTISCGELVFILDQLFEDRYEVLYDGYQEDPAVGELGVVTSVEELRFHVCGHAAREGYYWNLGWLCTACDELWAALTKPVHTTEEALILNQFA